MTRSAIVRRAMRTAFYAAAAMGFCAAMALPLVWAAASSLKPLEDVYAFPPTFSASSPQWSNYRDAMTRLPVARFMLNSMFIAIISVFGAVLTSSMAGYALARLRFRGRWILWFTVILSLAIPAQVLMTPRFFLYDLLGWVGTYKPLIVPAWLGGGAFNVFLFRQFFCSISGDMFDAAQLDGATPWQLYRYVALPIAKPAVVTAGLLSFVFHWQAFVDPLIYLSDLTTFPISLGLRMYQSLAGTWANLLMAASLIAMIPILVVFVLCENQLMKGLGVIGRVRGRRVGGFR